MTNKEIHNNIRVNELVLKKQIGSLPSNLAHFGKIPSKHESRHYFIRCRNYVRCMRHRMVSLAPLSLHVNSTSIQTHRQLFQKILFGMKFLIYGGATSEFSINANRVASKVTGSTCTCLLLAFTSLPYHPSPVNVPLSIGEMMHTPVPVPTMLFWKLV